MAQVGRYDAVVIGVSAGGLAALEKILPKLDETLPVPVLIVQHISPGSDNYMPLHFDRRCRVAVKEAEDKEEPQPGTVYFAPPNYHLLVELERSLALSTEERVNYSRPSIDVLFETAAEAFRERLIGIILTGANNDGARGLAKIKRFGGLTVVQSPETAEADAMPLAALEAVEADHVIPLSDIGYFINSLLTGEDI